MLRLITCVIRKLQNHEKPDHFKGLSFFIPRFSAVRFFLVWLSFSFSVIGGAQTSDIISDDLQKAVESGHHEKVIEMVNEALKFSVSNDEKQYLLKFIKATTLYEKGELEAALSLFQELKESPHSLKLYCHFYAGKILYKMAQYKTALAQFITAIALDPPTNIKNESRLYMGKIALEQKNYRAAYIHLKYVERRMRGTFEYPSVMWDLVKVEKSRNRKSRACRWARKLYWKYPSYDKVSHWDLDLPRNTFEGKSLYCSARLKDIKNRIRRLQWAGQSDRARLEIDRYKFDAPYTKDIVLSEFLVNEGFVSEGLNILAGYYQTKQTNYNYLMLLAKATAKISQYPTAIGLYYRAYRLSPRYSSGRKALFQAAFLSYQSGDYDGAMRMYDEFLRKFPGSSMVKDVRWYMAWTSYLKGDYEQAVVELNYIKKLKSKRRYRWRWRSIAIEKVNYWLAMSYLRMKDYEKGYDVLKSLADDPLKGYYYYAAQIRLEKFLKEGGVELIQSQRNAKGRTVAQIDAVVHSESFTTEAEEEEVNADTEAEEKDDEEEKDVAGAETEEDELKSLKNRRLKNHFSNGSLLLQIGYNELAKWEFYEIERRTKKKSFLESLMEKYQKLGAYNRIAYISQIYFGGERGRHGIAGVRHLWEKAYPQAYKEVVSNYAKKFQVPSEFIWSIMRAESVYKSDILSPVGARGLMQLMPHTAKQVSLLLEETDFDKNNLFTPEVNIRYGSRYLSRLGEKFNKTWPLVAAGYNAGPHRVYKWVNSFGHLDTDEFIEHIPFLETRRYVKKVTRFYSIYGELYDHAKTKPDWLAQNLNLQNLDGHTFRESWD
ncbi:MAG: transglycosylase SLT domain-containing protein [Bdellovibrionales bacterium]|nr:transglycosylase SLT domain-containing protein [Bdellovibrionales bacterium]